MQKMSGPHGCAQAPGMMNQFDVRLQSQCTKKAIEHLQYLGRTKSPREEARHPPTSSGGSSGAPNQMLAIFYAALLTSPYFLATQNVSQSFVAPPAPGRQVGAAPQPERERTIAPIESDVSQTSPSVISRVVDSLAVLTLGPVGLLFTSATPASAQDIPKNPSDFDRFNDLGPGGKFLAEKLSKGRAFLAQEYSSGVQNFNTYVREHPEQTGIVLEASTYVFGLISGARAGAIVGLAEGGVGAFPGAVAGGLAGLFITFTAQCGGKGLRETLGPKEVDTFVNKAVDMTAGPLRKIFPSLDETSARVAVSGGALLALTALHMKSIAAVAGEGVFVAGVEEMVAGVLHDASVRQVSDSLLTKKEEPGTFPVESGSAFDQLLHQTQKDLRKEVVQSAAGIEHTVMETIQKLKVAEKNPDKAAVAQEKEKIIRNAQAEINNPQVLTHLAQVVDIGTSIASLTGNAQFASQLHTGTQAVLGVIEGVNQFMTAVLSGASAGAYLGPVGLVSGGVAAVFSLFSGGQKDPLSEQLSAVYQALSQKLSDLTLTMIEGFRGLSDQINILDYHVLLGFSRVGQEIRDTHAVTVTSLQQMESWLQELMHVLAPEVHELVFKGVTETCLAIEDFPKGLGSLAKMEEKEFWSYARILENALRGVSPHHEFSNGFLFDVTSAEAINRVSHFPASESLSGFWGNFVQKVLGISIGIDPKTIPNRDSFLSILTRYLTLRQGASHISWDAQGTLLDEVGNAAKPLLAFSKFMHETPLVMNKLLSKLYQPAFETVKADFSQGFARVSDGLLDEVHSRIVRINREKIEQFPGYPGWPGARDGHVNWPTVADSKMASPHMQLKSGLIGSLDQGVLNKNLFKISVSRSREELLASVDTSALNGILLPKSGQPGHLIPIPLSFVQTRARAEIAQYIPKAVYLAQGLGIGTIECYYLQTSNEAGRIADEMNKEIAAWRECESHHHGNGVYPVSCAQVMRRMWEDSKKIFGSYHAALSSAGETISLEISFRKNDGSILPLGSATLRGACTINVESFFPNDERGGALRNLWGFEQRWREGDVVSPLVDRFSPHRLKSIWENADVVSVTPVNAASTNALLALADEELVRLRKKGISSFYASTETGYALTEVGQQLRRHMEVLDGAYTPIAPLTTIAGWSQAEQKELLALPNSETISRDHKRYLTESGSERTSFMPELPAGGIGPIVAHIDARYASMSKDSSYSEPVQKELAAFGVFRKEYPDVVRRREEVTQKRASEEKKGQGSSTQEIEELKVQVARLTELLQRMKL